jgi:hypothetical protein
MRQPDERLTKRVALKTEECKQKINKISLIQFQN